MAIHSIFLPSASSCFSIILYFVLIFVLFVFFEHVKPKQQTKGNRVNRVISLSQMCSCNVPKKKQRHSNFFLRFFFWLQYYLIAFAVVFFLFESTHGSVASIFVTIIRHRRGLWASFLCFPSFFLLLFLRFSSLPSTLFLRAHKGNQRGTYRKGGRV